jgi:hypothetical protein
VSGAEPPVDEEQAREDVAMIVSGHFTPDAIGPAAYDAVVQRARSDPEAYLAAFRDAFFGAAFDPLAQSLLHPSVLLDVLLPADPEGVRATAAALARQYDAVLVVLDGAVDAAALAEALDEETVRLTARLDDRRRELHELSDRQEP